jgi:hypothetical protein
MKDYPSAFCTVRIRHCSLKGSGSVGAISDNTPVQNISQTTDLSVSSIFNITQFFNKGILLKLFILFFFGSINIAFADPLSVRTTQQTVAISKSSIQGAFENVSGITRVNVTAGTGNLQQNSSAIAILNDSQLNAVSKVKSTQLTDNPASKHQQAMSAEIGPGAFNGARGITSINQSAGADNAQFNAMAVAVGGARPFAIVEMNESQLLGESQPVGLSLADQAGNTAEVNAATGFSKSAFNGARGVIQINQAAGIGNLTSNSFTMSVSK